MVQQQLDSVSLKTTPSGLRLLSDQLFKRFTTWGRLEERSESKPSPLWLCVTFGTVCLSELSSIKPQEVVPQYVEQFGDDIMANRSTRLPSERTLTSDYL